MSQTRVIHESMKRSHHESLNYKSTRIVRVSVVSKRKKNRKKKKNVYTPRAHETDRNTDPPCGLPYWDFIATRLLPCGPIDGTIEKFTGNDNVGPSPGLKEHLTITLHAFTHYVAVFSRGNFLLCDLQGFVCHFLVIGC